jgi:hypothetical protein
MYTWGHSRCTATIDSQQRRLTRDARPAKRAVWLHSDPHAPTCSVQHVATGSARNRAFGTKRSQAYRAGLPLRFWVEDVGSMGPELDGGGVVGARETGGGDGPGKGDEVEGSERPPAARNRVRRTSSMTFVEDRPNDTRSACT